MMVIIIKQYKLVIVLDDIAFLDGPIGFARYLDLDIVILVVVKVIIIDNVSFECILKFGDNVIHYCSVFSPI